MNADDLQWLRRGLKAEPTRFQPWPIALSFVHANRLVGQGNPDCYVAGSAEMDMNAVELLDWLSIASSDAAEDLLDIWAAPAATENGRGMAVSLRGILARVLVEGAKVIDRFALHKDLCADSLRHLAMTEREERRKAQAA